MADRVIQRYPAGLNAEFYNSPDTLWLKVTPRKIGSININSRGGFVHAVNDATYPTMMFLLSEDISYALNHDWSEEENVVGAAREVASKIISQFRKAKGNIGGGSVTAVDSKNDNPVYYKNTNRFEPTFAIKLAMHTNAEKDVYLPIQHLLEMSAPNIAGDIDFEFPYVFSVSTVTGNNIHVPLVRITDAALISIQPTYNMPYIGGYPASAEVSLTFKDLRPLYRETLSSKTKIQVETEHGS